MAYGYDKRQQRECLPHLMPLPCPLCSPRPKDESVAVVVSHAPALVAETHVERVLSVDLPPDSFPDVVLVNGVRFERATAHP